MTDAPAVSLRGVTFRFFRPPVLEAVDLDLPARAISCLVGPNGGGKSTLLKLILGLLQPESGTLRVLGTTPRRARARVGYMPQQVQFDPRFPVTVEAIVGMGRLRGNLPSWPARGDRRIIERVLDEVELLPHRREPYSSLSGGQKQRVLIARALAVEPELLLLDEPTAMVDAHIEAHLLGKLRELHRRMTIVLVSHDVAFVAGLVENVVCVNRSVVTHPAAAVRDGLLADLYGGTVKSVQHHHHIAPPGGGEGCRHV
jgi:zinc transport system ATP-binding protein